MKPESFIRNLGFITGPLIMCLGIFAYIKKISPPVGVIMIGFGLMRFVVTISQYLKYKNENRDQQ